MAEVMISDLHVVRDLRSGSYLYHGVAIMSSGPVIRDGWIFFSLCHRLASGGRHTDDVQ